MRHQGTQSRDRLGEFRRIRCRETGKGSDIGGPKTGNIRQEHRNGQRRSRSRHICGRSRRALGCVFCNGDSLSERGDGMRQAKRLQPRHKPYFHFRIDIRFRAGGGRGRSYCCCRCRSCC